jgi:hypothetical protein
MTVLSAALPGAVRRHLGTFRACVRTPADAWLLARMTAWAVWLPMLKYLLPLPKLVRLASAAPRGTGRRPEQEGKIIALSRWIYAPVFPADRGCLQRSLLAYRFLGEANAGPRLLVGVRKDAGKVLAHAWVSVDGEPRGEAPDWVAGFKAMLAFGADGRPQPAE